jgi:hypothetical protein
VWKFEAVIDAAQHSDLINHSGEISSDYFEMQINSRKENWVERVEKWDLISYSVQQTIASSIAKVSITVGGFFHHVSRAVRR